MSQTVLYLLLFLKMRIWAYIHQLMMMMNPVFDYVMYRQSEYSDGVSLVPQSLQISRQGQHHHSLLDEEEMNPPTPPLLRYGFLY